MAEKLGQEEYDSRKIGWFKIDFEKSPTLAMSDDKVNQMVVTRGMSRNINFTKISEERSDNVAIIATILKELTGDWAYPIACDEI